MAYVDLLLHIDSYPALRTDAAIDEAVALAASLGGRLTGIAVEVEIPMRSNRLADYLIGLSAMAEAEEARSRTACQDSLAHFTKAATAASVLSTISKKVNHHLVADDVATVARTYDLCVLPMVGGIDGQMEVADRVVFESGQPILIRAKRVQVLTVLNEKSHAVAQLGEAAQRHLQIHGVSATLHEVDAGGEKMGTIFDRYIKEQKPDLLVMGGYGHSRAREFLLGGATEHALKAPTCPVLLSH